MSARFQKKLKEAREDEILVKFKTAVLPAARDDKHRREGHRKLRELRGSGVHHIRISPSVTVEEAVASLVEVPALGIELLLHIDEFGVGQEVTDAPEERKGALFDEGMGAALDESEIGEGFLGEKPLVAETHETLADLVRIETEVGGAELLVEARVTHAGVDEDTLAGEDGQEVLG